MSEAKLVNIARLMTTYNFEIEQLPDNLKCAQCKLVLKDACQVPCGCTYCRACIDDMIARAVEFCPGGSEDCGESVLSRFLLDYKANKNVSRLTVKCPHDGCVHKCQLANMEEHLRECPKKYEECPFRELGCTQDKLAAEEMGGHLQRENRRHSEILIRMIVNVNKEIETLKQRDEASSREIEMLKQRDEASSRDIEMLKQRDEASSREIETLKHELVLKDEQIRSIMDQMIHSQNDIKSIKEEKEDLAGRVRILSEKIERETAERRKNQEVESARVIGHVDREIAAVTKLIGSNKDKLSTEMQSMRGDIATINRAASLIKDDICSVKSQVQSIQMLVGRVDASCDWLIKDDLKKKKWEWGDRNRNSEYFSGALHPYKYQIRSMNTGGTDGTLTLELCMHPGPKDEQLKWPFKGRVLVTVSGKDSLGANCSKSLQIQFDRPTGSDCSRSNDIDFPHSELQGIMGYGGVRVTCVIVPIMNR